MLMLINPKQLILMQKIGITLVNDNKKLQYDKINSKLNFGNASYNSVQNLLPSHDLTKSLKA